MIPAITGMPNTIPAAPGLDERVKETFGRGVVIRRFRSRSPCPLDFFLMMLPVGAAHLVAPCTLLTILNRRTFGPEDLPVRLPVPDGGLPVAQEGDRGRRGHEEGMKMAGTDKLRLLVIFAPILLKLVRLTPPKEAMGCGPLTGLWGCSAGDNGRCLPGRKPAAAAGSELGRGWRGGGLVDGCAAGGAVLPRRREPDRAAPLRPRPGRGTSRYQCQCYNGPGWLF